MGELLLIPNSTSDLRIDPTIQELQQADLTTAFDTPGDAEANEQELKSVCKKMRPLLTRLQASQSHSVLLVFQALDAAGKDSMIRALFSGLDPAITKLAAFKSPSEIERRHDFLWRTSKKLPARGELGIFNRSYYEEVLVVRVHPSFLGGQFPAGVENPDQLWPLRYQAINAHEKQLASSSTMVLKFWLNVSVVEQKRRFLSRLERSKKRWKFNPRDVEEMTYRSDYDKAFIEMVNATSTNHAPWFMVPADDKPRARLEVGKIILQALEGMDLQYPELDPEINSSLADWQQQLSS